ncbi:MAG: lipid-A-disaccharide synthase [Coxiellaceae bacterium]|jgi:lipid-A-disaccharide synthase|nr:lipid-A-disaccharide synthase [Coxiellaceae bacterium]
MQKINKRILISAGELSGDIHASILVKEITKLSPKTAFYGMGGKLMQESGVDILVDSSDLNIIGGIEIISKLIKLILALLTMRNSIRHKSKRPDLLILVDYPGFNLLLAKIAKRVGVKVLYYISPKIWAWNRGRVQIIKKYVDIMAVIFPFEVEFYKKYGIPVYFVGNPLLKKVVPKLSKETAKQIFNLNPNCKIIGLFPGSRHSEIRRLLPIMLKAAQILKNKDPTLQFLLSQASSITDNDLLPYLQVSPIKPKIISGQNYDAMQVCDVIIAASGTITLEITLMNVPLVIIYTMSWIEYQLAKNLIKIPYVGLCNILANKKIAPELLQKEASPIKIANTVCTILSNKKLYRQIKIDLQNVKKYLQNKEKIDISKVIMEVLK